MLHKPLFRLGDIVHMYGCPYKIDGLQYIEQTWTGGDGFGYRTERTESCHYGFMSFTEGDRISRFLERERKAYFCM